MFADCNAIKILISLRCVNNFYKFIYLLENVAVSYAFMEQNKEARVVTC